MYTVLLLPAFPSLTWGAAEMVATSGGPIDSEIGTITNVATQPTIKAVISLSLITPWVRWWVIETGTGEAR